MDFSIQFVVTLHNLLHLKIKVVFTTFFLTCMSFIHFTLFVFNCVLVGAGLWSFTVLFHALFFCLHNMPRYFM